MCVSRAATGGAPGVENVCRDGEGFGFPVQGLAGGCNFLSAQRRAMDLVGALLVGSAETDHRLAGDEGRAVGLVGFLDRGGDLVGIMAINANRVPVHGLEAGDLVGRIRQGDGTVDGDVVIVPEQYQLAQLEVAGERDGFVADALHQAAVTAQYIGVVVLQVAAELLFQLALGDRHANGIGNALAERTGGGFDARGMTEFRMAGGLGAELAELLDVLDGHVLVARQIEQRVEQHRAMPGRQDETIAVCPERRLRIEFQVTGE